MVSKGSKFCSKVRHLKEFELGAGRGRLTSPCRWLCWWQGKAATPAQRNPLLMHQQSMYLYNVHTLYTVHTYRGPWQCASSSCIYGIIFLAESCAQSLIFFSFMTKSAQTVANMFLSINISNSDNLNSTTSNYKLASAKARVESVIDQSMTVWTDTMVQPAPLQTVIDWSMTVF